MYVADEFTFLAVLVELRHANVFSSLLDKKQYLIDNQPIESLGITFELHNSSTETNDAKPNKISHNQTQDTQLQHKNTVPILVKGICVTKLTIGMSKN